jgi:BRCT domain type II-containing protein
MGGDMQRRIWWKKLITLTPTPLYLIPSATQACWKVPYRVWGGLSNPNDEDQTHQDLAHMEEVLLTNFGNLPPETQREFVRHVLNRKNWARKSKRSQPPPDLEEIRRRGPQKEKDDSMKASADVTKDSSPTANEEAVEKVSAHVEATSLNETVEHVKEEQVIDAEDYIVRAKSAAKATPASVKKSAKKGSSDEAECNPEGGKAVTGKSVAKKEPGNKASKKRTLDNEPESVPSEVAKRPNIMKDTTNCAIIPKKKPTKTKFVIPRPGVDGAEAGCYEGKRFVLTGIFPEVGGGAGLNFGKDKVKDMIESFGGKVTSAISGLTSFLVVGKEPGTSKVMKAKSRGIPLVDLKALKERIMGEIPALEQVQAPAIREFSAGYKRDLIDY